MIRPPPRSTLFPYTPLSRSGATPPPLGIARVLPRSPDRAHRAAPPELASRRDRKSTRLNSSHSQISYAVFCLKKKKNTLVQFLVSCMLPPRITTALAAHLST